MNNKIFLGYVTIGSCSLLIFTYFVNVSVYIFGLKYDPLIYLTMYSKEVAMVLWLVLIFLSIYYIYVIFRHLDMSGEMKFLWIVAFFFASYLVLPVFWYLHIRGESLQERNG